MTIKLTENDIRDAFNDVAFDRPVSRIIAGAKRRQHRRRMTMVAIPAMGVVAAGGTALLTSDKLNAGNVTCFESADPESMPFGGYSPNTTGARSEELCAKEWRDGFMDVQRDLKGEAPFPVPPLKACATRDGGIGVFPTNVDDFCDAGPVAKEYGLFALPEDYEEHIDRYVAMRSALTERIRVRATAAGGSETKACLDQEAATSLVEEVLAGHGYEGWTIKVVHYDPDMPCWMEIYLDNAGRNVDINSTRRGVHNIWIDGRAVFPQP